jgi:hypothetical protein
LAKVKAVIQTGVPANKKRYRKNLNRPDSHGGGIFQDRILEAHPHYNAAPSEAVTEGENNNFIVLGRDRPKGLKSGYGGKGDTHSGKIDIVVGMQGINVKEESEDGQRLYTDPDPILDAARIYISQKTDIDDNFHLKDGKVGNVKTRSAIAIKADGVRVIGREGIKLVTGTDKYNSQGVEISSVSGIDLIAGNIDSEVEPIPKGKKLAAALEDLTKMIENLNDIVTNLSTNQAKLIQDLMNHTHVSPVGPTTPSPDFIVSGPLRLIDYAKVVAELGQHKANCATHKINFYKPSGKKYINSRYNNTN